jgi:alkyl sulfatase BDS1-like metallo-beta-lactamase superfamily hydrolase
MYGTVLDRGPAGQFGAGLDLTNSTGSVGLIPPTVDITHTGQEEIVDDVRISFQLTAGTGAGGDELPVPDQRAFSSGRDRARPVSDISAGMVAA